MTEPVAPEERTEEEQSFWASFDQADMKLFLVTFAGTLAATILAVVVVGLGLLLIRLARDQHQGFMGLVDTAGVAGGGAIIVLTPVLLLSRRTRKRAVDAAANVAAIMILAILLLAAIGYLAGIK